LTWENSIILEKGEKIVSSWKGDIEISERVVVKRRIQEAKGKLLGFLVLTNQKILFLEEHGVFGKSYHQGLSIPLGKVGAISMGGALIYFVSIADDIGTHVFHLRGVGKKEFEPFRQSIMECCQKRREEIEAERKKERVQVVLDFSALKEHMEKGGLVLQKTKCPECGAPIMLPEVGNQTKCEHCGSMIYAQDIYEKLKSLIG
jgi:ribosomal protein S27AE